MWDANISVRGSIRSPWKDISQGYVYEIIILLLLFCKMPGSEGGCGLGTIIGWGAASNKFFQGCIAR